MKELAEVLVGMTDETFGTTQTSTRVIFAAG